MISAQKTRVFYPLWCIRKSGREAPGSRWASRNIPFIYLTFINFISFHISNIEITEGELLAHASKRVLTNSSRSEAERSAGPRKVEQNHISAPRRHGAPWQLTFGGAEAEGEQREEAEDRTPPQRWGHRALCANVPRVR